MDNFFKEMGYFIHMITELCTMVPGAMVNMMGSELSTTYKSANKMLTNLTWPHHQ